METATGTFTTAEMSFFINYYGELPSTNATAYRLAMAGAREGTVVVAEVQTDGRGRLGRKWFSPAGENIYLSLILRPDMEPQFASQIPIVVGLAVHTAIAAYIPDVTLKWPNDILVAERKICGVLSEMKFSPTGIDFVVVGIGINVNQAPEDFDTPIRNLATSIFSETGEKASRAELLKKVLARVGELYYRRRRCGFTPLKAEWLAASAMMGRLVAVKMRDTVVRGRVLGMGECGSLICEDEGGGVVEISAGDATIIKG